MKALTELPQLRLDGLLATTRYFLGYEPATAVRNKALEKLTPEQRTAAHATATEHSKKSGIPE